MSQVSSFSGINFGLELSHVKFLLSPWKTYMCNLMAWNINKIEVGIPVGTHWVPLRADLFSYYYERDVMSQVHKSKGNDLIDVIKDTS